MSNSSDEFRGLLEAMNDLYQPVEEADTDRNSDKGWAFADWKEDPAKVLRMVDRQLRAHGLKIAVTGEGDSYRFKVIRA